MYDSNLGIHICPIPVYRYLHYLHFQEHSLQECHLYGLPVAVHLQVAPGDVGLRAVCPREHRADGEGGEGQRLGERLVQLAHDGGVLQRGKRRWDRV